MRLKQLLLALLLCTSFFSYGQKPYYNQQEDFLNANSKWIFGDSAGLDFKSGSAIGIKTNFKGREGSASAADPKTGALLFYSDGNECRDATGQIMPNGDSMFKKISQATAQAVCIVPVIGSTEKFYLFRLLGVGDGQFNIDKEINPNPSGSGLFYSVVDMSLNSGLGDIVSGQKRILLDSDSLSEAMIAIPGNNCDIWLVVHAYGKPVFKAYHITAEGIDTVPVTSINANLPPYLIYLDGGMAVSPDRNLICMIGAGSTFTPYPHSALLSKFNPSIGTIYDAILLDDKILSYVPAFSDDGSKLYLNNYNYFSSDQDRGLLQFDVSNYDSSVIVNSKIVLPTKPVPPGNLFYLKLYKDTIYVSFGIPYGTAFDFIGTINNPNLPGPACDFHSISIPLATGTKGMLSLPNEVVYPINPDTIYSLIMDTLICSGWESGIPLYNSSISDKLEFKWDNGSSDPIRFIQNSGIYWVEYINRCHYYVDTFIVRGSTIKGIINVNGFELSTTILYRSYQWLLNGNLIPGASKEKYTVTENGDYSVIVMDENGCVDTSDFYTVKNVTSTNEYKFPKQDISTYPNPVKDIIHINSPVKVSATLMSIDGKLLRQEHHATSLSISDLPGGIYLLRLADESGKLIKIKKVIKMLLQ